MYILYIKSDCSYCEKAQKLLEDHSEQYRIIDLTGAPSVWNAVKIAYGWDTVPMILSKEGKFFVLVGGFTDLEGYLASSE